MTEPPRHHEAARSNLLMSPLVALAGFGATIVVVRALAPRDFAVYAVVLAFKGTVQFASDFGTGAAATRLFGELQAQGAGGQAWRAYLRLLALRAAIALALIVAVVALPDTFADLLGLDRDERDIVPLLVAIGVFEAVSSLGYSVLAGLLRHRWINRAVLASTLLQPAAVIVAAAAGWGLVGITAGLLLGSVVRSGGFHAAAIAALRSLEDRGAVSTPMARAYVRTATGSIAGKVAAWIHSRQLVTLIAIQTTARADVAVFALAYDLTQQVVTALSTPFSSLLLPMQASSVGDEERAGRIYRTAVRLLAYVVIPPSLVLLAVFPALVHGVFGAGYGDATVFGVVFIPAAAAEVVLSGPATALMLADDRVLHALARIKLAAIVLGALYFALADADLLIIAGVMMGVRTASTLAMLAVIRRRLGLATLGPWLPRLLGVSVFAAACAGAPQLVVDSDIAALVIGLALALVALAVTVPRFRVIEREDAALAAQLLPAAAPLLERLAPGSSRAA